MLWFSSGSAKELCRCLHPDPAHPGLRDAGEPPKDGGEIPVLGPAEPPAAGHPRGGGGGGDEEDQRSGPSARGGLQ